MAAIELSILVRILQPHMRRSRIGWVRALAEYRGVGPTGPDGRWTRTDRLLASAVAGLGTLALLGAAALLMSIAERFAVDTRAHLVLMGAGFVGAILGMMAATMCVVHLLCAPFARASVPRPAAR
ncbi:MAG TPA: hypothetical protein VFH27_12150 [Longimicrobiaceae bacterium]|nr:hypothetical protein [Longimicrobiaceae bacterium]